MSSTEVGRAPETPTQDGPAIDPALLAAGAGGSSADAETAGLQLTMQAMRRYQKEAVEMIENVRMSAEKGSKLSSEAVGSINNGANQIVQDLANMKEAPVPVSVLTESFVLSTLGLAVFGISSVLGSYMLSTVMSFFIPAAGAGLFASLLPVFAAIFANQREMKPLEQHSMVVGISFAQGLLAGHATASSYLFATPFATLSPVVAVYVLPLVAKNGRFASLGAMAGAAFAAHFIIGTFVGMMSMSYLTLSVLYVSALAVPFQYAMANREANVSVLALATIGLTVFARVAIFAFFGSSAPIESNEPSFAAEPVV